MHGKIILLKLRSEPYGPFLLAPAEGCGVRRAVRRQFSLYLFFQIAFYSAHNSKLFSLKEKVGNMSGKNRIYKKAIFYIAVLGRNNIAPG